MIVFLLQHLFVAAEAGVDRLHRMDVLFLEVGQHDLIDAGQRHGVIDGAVMVEGRDLEVLVDGIQLVVAQTRKERLPHRQCVDIGVLVPADARLLPCLADEQHIKAVGVMGHKDVVPAKFFKSADGLLGRRGVGDHGIVDAGQVNDLLRDRLAGVDEGAELLFLVDLAVFNIDCADFGQALGVGVETRRLGVKDDERAGERHLGAAVDCGDHVIDEVGLTAVNQFKVRVCFVDGIGGQHRFGVALADTVVGDGNGAVAHAVSQTHDLAGVVEAVHRAGLGVQVQLDALFAVGRGILALLTLDLQNVVGHDDKVMLVLVVHIVAADDEGRAGLEALPLGHIRAFFPHDLEVDGAGVVGDGGKINLAAAALDLGSKDVAPDRDLAAVAQIIEAAGVGGLELLAVEQLDRLVREGETFNRKVGRCLLGLELDNGGLLLQVLLKLLLGAHLTGIGQADDRQTSCALLDHLGQHAGQLDALKDLAARADVDRDAVLAKGDGLGLIEEAVDRHPLFFQFLDHQAHGLGGDVRVGKVAADLQLIPGEHLGKGRTKTPAQRLIQRFSTAQADDDLSLCAVKLHAVHKHTAERRAELLVRRKLRPDLGDKWFQMGVPHKWV